MNRRRIFKLVALSLAGLALPKSGWSALRADTVFEDIYGDVGLAAHLGRLHAASDPGAKMRGRALIARLGSFRSSRREAQFNQQKQADLAALDLVTIDGWVMARSEADLCAAVYLDRSAA